MQVTPKPLTSRTFSSARLRSTPVAGRLDSQKHYEKRSSLRHIKNA